MSTNKKLGQKSKSDWSYTCLFKAAILAPGVLAQVSSVRETRLLSLMHRSYGALTKLPHEPTGPCSAQQASSVDQGGGRAATQLRRPVSAAPVAFMRWTTSVSSTPRQRCLGTAAPTPHTQPYEVPSAPRAPSITGRMNSD